MALVVGASTVDASIQDAYGRLKSSTPHTLFESRPQYTLQPMFWQTVTSGTGGSATHVPAQASISLSLTGAAAGRCLRQTYRYFKTASGKSHTVIMTGLLGATVTNVVKRIGYYDDSDGMFFELDGTAGLRVVTRTSVGGSPVDTPVNKASWNIDHMDGTGPSGKTIDITKAQIFVIDIQSCHVGRVLFGVIIDGKLYYVHQFLASNLVSVSSFRTNSLPCRFEIVSSASSSAASMVQMATTVATENLGDEERGYSFVASNGGTAISVSSRRPILSIRPKTTFNSITNRRSILPYDFSFVSDGSCYIELVFRPTLTTPSWVDVNVSYSSVEYDVSSTALTDGIVIDAVYGSADRRGTGSIYNLTHGLLQLALDYAGTTADILSLVVTPVGNTPSVAAHIGWRELAGIS